MKPNESRWLVPLLQTIRGRPGLFLGGADETQPGVFGGGCFDVATLALYLAAYAAGRESIEGQQKDAEFEILSNDFADWLISSGQLDLSSAPSHMRLLGWVTLTKRVAEARGEVDSLGVFYRLFDRFVEGAIWG
ncbi:MAG: hypothetical protein JNJ54_25895 [Myxococcaceae bacterium]|nr:hypothetical protein [Myxococcaceae bacterium]